MASLDSILNTVIPIGVVLIFLGLIYSRVKTPVNSFFRMIWGWIGRLKDRVSDKKETYETIYRYG